MFPAGASPEGVHDLAGNAYEWARRPKDPAGAQAGDLRGGAWLDDADVLRIGFDRFNVPGSAADDRGDDVGFRVVAPASR
jgi:formylglycine-generating enzyme required for sulfatase activity